MSSRTKIVVLHMKEIIYTAIFAALGILLIVLLVIMFRPDGKADGKNTGKQYNPGIYTSSLTLNNTNLEVEVSVDEWHLFILKSTFKSSLAAISAILLIEKL